MDALLHIEPLLVGLQSPKLQQPFLLMEVLVAGRAQLQQYAGTDGGGTIEGVILNPTPEQLADLVNASSEKAVKWLKVTATGDMHAWCAEQQFHRDVAAWLGIERAAYKKGLAAPAEGSRRSEEPSAARGGSHDG